MAKKSAAQARLDQISEKQTILANRIIASIAIVNTTPKLTRKQVANLLTKIAYEVGTIASA